MKPTTTIHLPDELPKDYPNGNLLGLPASEYIAIIEDKQLWLLAHEKIQEPRYQVRDWLETLEPEHVKEDMRRRLNELARK